MGKNGLIATIVVNPFKTLVLVFFVLILLLQVPAARNIAQFSGTAAGQAIGLSVEFVKNLVKGASQTMPDINVPSSGTESDANATRP